MNLRQEILETELEAVYKRYGYESRITQYHIEKYREEFEDTNFIKKINGNRKTN